MIRAILFLLLLLALSGANPTYPTCATIGKTNPCVTTSDLLGDQTINIRFFGAKGDGVTDDTAAIQTAIDYAANNNIQNIFCPNGNYLTSATIYLDPPGNLRSNFANPTKFNFSFSFIGQNEGGANHEGYGCNILPNFNNAVAFMVGPGQGMRVAGIQVRGPNNAYRGNLNTAGVGIGISGGNGGASRTLIERTWVENFYACYQTSANTNGALSDSNTFFKTAASNCFVGMDFPGTQNDINHLDDVLVQGSTIAVRSTNGRPILVSSGNLSATNGQFANFTNTTTAPLINSGGFFSFTSTIGSPDIYWPNVYNSFTLSTTSFGIVPLSLTNWNAGTSVATFQIEPLWVWNVLGHADITSSTDIKTEIQAAHTVYAVERVTTLQGQAISSDNTHIENPSICTTFLDLLSNFTGLTTPHINSPFFNFDPAMSNKSGVNIGLLFCAQTFPLVRTQITGNNTKLVWTGGDFGQSGCGFAPILFEFQPFYEASFSKLNFINQINIRVTDQGGAAYAEPGGGVGINNYENVANGAGFWDANYFVPQAVCPGGIYSTLLNIMTKGVIITPYVGFHPAPWASPNLSPYVKALIDAAGALGTYPPISCQTVYKSIEWNSATTTHAHLRSASCPGWSWGQDLNNANTGSAVSWYYKGQSGVLYTNTTTISWMFPGLVFTLNGGNNPSTDPYVVTGVYPQLGFVTAMDVSNSAIFGGSPLQGVLTTTYSCATGCALKQAPFGWTAY